MTPLPWRREQRSKQSSLELLRGMRIGAGFPPYLHVVVAQRPAEFIIVHAGLVLADPPEPGHLLCLQQLELAVVGGPADDILVLGLLEQLEEELPQGDGTVHSRELQFTKAG